MQEERNQNKKSGLVFFCYLILAVYDNKIKGFSVVSEIGFYIMKASNIKKNSRF